MEGKVIEERLIAVVCDGAGTMGAYVDRLNAAREKARKVGKGCGSLPDPSN